MAAKRIKIRAKKLKRIHQAPRVSSTAAWTLADRLPSAGRWLAAGALVAYSAIGSDVAIAQQQPRAGASGSSKQAQTLSVVQFNIPAGALEDVVKAFETASGMKVTIENSQLFSVPSPGVSGPLTAEAGLKRLLDKTNISYRLSQGEAILELRASFAVDVSDSIPIVSSPKYTEPLRDIPQTITIIPQSVIAQQGAMSLTDVLRNVPGITLTAGEGGTAAGDNLTVRGFSARNDIFVDGVRDLSPQSRDPFNFEQVEVTKGPTSATSGRGSAGGTINMVSKSPSLMHSVSGTVALGNASQRRESIDINTPLPLLGERTGFRLNGLYHNAGVPGRDYVKNDRWGVAPSLAFGLGTPTRLTLSYQKLKQSNISDYGIPYVPATNQVLTGYRDRPAPVARNTFYGIVDRDHEYLNQDNGTVKIEHDFTDTFTLRSQLRYGTSGRNSVASPARFDGDLLGTVHREVKSWVANDNILDSQTDAKISFSTGRITHNLVTGLSLTRENNERINRTGANTPVSLLDPNPHDPYVALAVSPFVGNLTGVTQGLYAFDTAHFGSHWEATGGVRWERFDVNGVNTTPLPVTQNVKMTSMRSGIIYKPKRSGSIYASYGTSLSPSLEGLSYSTSNTSIPPEKTYTTEVGSKWDIFGSRMLLSGAVFRVAKDNARTPGILPTDPPQILAGTQVSKGVELSATGNINRSLRLIAGYTFVDGKISSSNTPAEVGKYFQNTPRHSASMWITYTQKRYTLGLGPRFMGLRYGNNTNTRMVPAYTAVDAMASVNVNAHLDFRINATNLTNRYYFDRLSGGHVVPGAGRGVLVATNFRF